MPIMPKFHRGDKAWHEEEKEAERLKKVIGRVLSTFKFRTEFKGEPVYSEPSILVVQLLGSNKRPEDAGLAQTEREELIRNELKKLMGQVLCWEGRHVWQIDYKPDLDTVQMDTMPNFYGFQARYAQWHNTAICKRCGLKREWQEYAMV